MLSTHITKCFILFGALHNSLRDVLVVLVLWIVDGFNGDYQKESTNEGMEGGSELYTFKDTPEGSLGELVVADLEFREELLALRLLVALFNCVI